MMLSTTPVPASGLHTKRTSVDRRSPVSSHSVPLVKLCA